MRKALVAFQFYVRRNWGSGVEANPHIQMWKWRSLSHVWLTAAQWIYSPRSSPGPNTGVGSGSLLQEIFPTQGSNPALPHCRQVLYQLSHQGSPRILEWVVHMLFNSKVELKIPHFESGPLSKLWCYICECNLFSLILKGKCFWCSQKKKK